MRKKLYLILDDQEKYLYGITMHKQKAENIKDLNSPHAYIAIVKASVPRVKNTSI